MIKLFTSITFFSIIGLGNLLGHTIVTNDPELKTVVVEEYIGIYCEYCPNGLTANGNVSQSLTMEVVR